MSDFGARLLETMRRWYSVGRGWPKYLPGGRIRTSTVVLIIALVGLSWIYGTYQPPAAVKAPETAVVPPGFMPDPAYTWVPRTNVRTQPRTTTTTPTTTTTTESTETTPTEPSDPNAPAPTTFVDPDGPGPLPPTPVTTTPVTPTSAPTPPSPTPPPPTSMLPTDTPTTVPLHSPGSETVPPPLQSPR